MIRRSSTYVLAALVALSSIFGLPSERSARASECAPPEDVDVVYAPATDCLATTDAPACNGGVEITITNNCGVDVLGIERQSSVQNLPPGYPPLQACVQPWQDAMNAGMDPPFCVLSHGATGTGFAWGGDKLVFDVSGATVVADLIKIEPPLLPGSKGEETGCAAAPGSRSNAGALGAALIAAAALTARSRRRRPR